MQQLDIFADNRDVMLRNDVLAPLQRRDVAAARTALAQLAGEYPDDGALPAMRVLVRELERGSPRPFLITRRWPAHAGISRTRSYLPPGGCCPRRMSSRGSRRAGERLLSGPNRYRFVPPTQTVTPCRCGFWRATGRLRLKQSKPLSPGRASRHRSRG